LIAGGIVLGAGLIASLIWFVWIAPAPALLLIFLFSFFRDPERRVPPGNCDIVSAADGTVVKIDEVFEADYLNEQATRISIFLSVFNVHVNRAPCAGIVEYVNYAPGAYHAAWAEDASKQNERNSIGISSEGPCGRVLVRQIAGLIARRIVGDVDVSDQVVKGQRIGMIKFGSRTEVYVARSTGFQPRVTVGDKVAGGETILGVIPEQSGSHQGG
jgi:phosphatidylserine decarboxylase